MARLTVNPDAEVSTGFEAVKPGTYRMKIDSVKDRNPEKNDLEVKLVHITPASELVNIAGEPLKGIPSSIFDYVQLVFEKQWKLRSLVEACGLPWGDLDPEVDLQGREVDVVIKLEEYQGEQRNKLGRYIVPK